MAINPENITTVRVDQLAPATLDLTKLIAISETNGDLKQSTVQALADLIATTIEASGGVGFLPLVVTDGQQLPDVPENPSFFLCGAGTYLNVNGYDNIICTEALNAVVSLTDHWQLAVEIPIVATVGVQTVTGSAVDNTDPLNPVINSSGGSGGVPTLDEVLGEGGRLVRFTPNDDANAVFVLADRQKVVLKRGTGDFFLNSGIFSVGDELIFEAILDGWGGGVSFGSNPIFVNGVDVSNDAVPIQSNQRGYLFLSEIVSGVEYWIYRVVGDIIQDNVFMLRSNNGSDIPNIATFRTNLGVDKITNRGNADYNILSTDKAVVTNANFTAPRTFTLPLANSVNAGYEIIVADLFGGVSSTNTLTISRNGSDTVNGANTVVIGAQYGMRRLFSDGVSKWTFDGGVMRISDYIGTTLTPSVIVATDINSKLQPLPTSTYPSLAELAHVKGVTSAIQTQLNNRTLNIIKRATASSAVTGTTVESILTTDEIVGNTFSTNDILQLVSARFIKTGALGTCTYRIRINTTNSLSGAVTIATFNNAGIYAKIGNRTFTITGGNLRGFSFTDNGITGGQDTGTTSLPEASTSYNPANSLFIFTTAQLANGGDSTICREFLITN